MSIEGKNSVLIVPHVKEIVDAFIYGEVPQEQPLTIDVAISFNANLGGRVDDRIPLTVFQIPNASNTEGYRLSGVISRISPILRQVWNRALQLAILNGITDVGGLRDKTEKDLAQIPRLGGLQGKVLHMAFKRTLQLRN